MSDRLTRAAAALGPDFRAGFAATLVQGRDDLAAEGGDPRAIAFLDALVAFLREADRYATRLPAMVETLDLLLDLDPADVSWLTFTGMTEDELRRHLANAATTFKFMLKPSRETTAINDAAMRRALNFPMPTEPPAD
jgi:hypothetical protein